MTAQKNYRWVVWVILLLCAIAVPVGILTKDLSTGSGDSSSSDYLIKYKDRIQVIRLTGMIADKVDSSSLLSSSTGSAPSVVKKLRKAIKNDKIKGILLRINSPGGTVSTSQELYEAVEAVRAKGIPVICSMGDMAASGGYYTACICDKIYAQPGTLTGSIGVIMNMPNVKGLGDKIGIQSVVIKSGKFKDIASMYRPMTPEEEVILKKLIDDSYEQFTNAIAKGRKMNIEDVKKLADGRIYSGQQAKQLGLIDELGGYDDALAGLQAMLKDKLKLKSELAVEDSTSESILSTILSMSSPIEKNIGLNITEELVPEWLTAKYFKQPLWVLQ